MANQEHIDILKQGVEAWDHWRRNNMVVIPDLSGADICGMILWRGNFSRVNFSNARLVKTDFQFSNLSSSNFSGADMRHAGLCRANLQDAILTNANLRDAVLGGTVFANTNLGGAKWIETVVCLGDSSLDVATLRLSGRLPISLLRQCRWPGKMIFDSEGLTSGDDDERYSCFISYSSKDSDFAEKFHSSLTKQRILCWFAPHDLRIGEKIRDSIEHAIKRQEKLLLVLSKNSIESEWVEDEVEAAFEKERIAGQSVLFPIFIDHEFMLSEKGWVSKIRRTRNAGDFKGWDEDATFDKSLSRLLKDLKVSS